MAYVDPVESKVGEITSCRVKWRLGGARDGDWQGERFLDVTSAEVFRDAVNDNDQQWPPGWVKGERASPRGRRTRRGSSSRRTPGSPPRNRTGIEDRYRGAITKELEAYLLPTFRNCDVRSTDHF
ncbi:hypothetical protein [Streptomyces sp. NPDC026589]|uniref:hypothetical protein n=1 Tax=Streptomyces sp. NPDC026589 TaxID=3155609 RepID=UPI0033E0A56C